MSQTKYDISETSLDQSIAFLSKSTITSSDFSLENIASSKKIKSEKRISERRIKASFSKSAPEKKENYDKSKTKIKADISDSNVKSIYSASNMKDDKFNRRSRQGSNTFTKDLWEEQNAKLANKIGKMPHEWYTDKVVQEKINAIESISSTVQYRQDTVQQSMKSIREEWQSSTKRRGSNTSLSSLKSVQSEILSSKSRKKIRRKSRRIKKFNINLKLRPSISNTPKGDDILVRSKSIREVRGSLSSRKSFTRSMDSFHVKRILRSFIRRKQATENRVNLINKSLEQYQKFQVPGVRTLKLTDSTQRILGFREKINFESPWFTVNINETLDKIKLLKKYNEALKILEIIVPYMGNEILMGFFPYPRMFLACATPEAKDRVLTIMENDVINNMTLLKTTLYKTPFRWLSFGSEMEIFEETRTLRSLFLIDISIMVPFSYQEPIKLKIRKVEDAKDGYVELLSTRKTYNNIFRSTLDVSIQVGQSLVSVGCQSDDKVLKVRGTQYYYEYDEIRLTKQQNINLMLFLKQEYKNIEQSLIENNYMKIFAQDYNILRHQILMKTEPPKQILHFWDLKCARNKRVIQVVWNPWISGNIAVVYSESKAIVTEENYSKTNLWAHNYVLIWDYDIHNKPEQYLFSEKVITTVCFSPYNSRIILGGCETGNILVWILPIVNLDKQQEILTDSMYNNRGLMKEMTSWIRNLYEQENMVKAVAFSSSNFCHLGQVNCIKWLLPKYKFATTGELLTMENPKDQSLQFFSCGVDGNVFIWDLPKLDLTTGATFRKKDVGGGAHRYANILKEKLLIPRYQIQIPSTNTPSCLKYIEIPNQNMKFEIIESTRTKNVYKSVEHPNNKTYSSEIFVVTYFGTIIHAKWDTHDFILNDKNGNLKVSKIIHDGPVVCFEINPNNPNVALSVGGKIFAVWYIKKLDQPIFWRKRPVNLVSGFWSLTNPEELSIATFNANLEQWNFLKGGKDPGSTTVLANYPIVSLYNDIYTKHAHPDNLIIIDVMDSIKVFKITEDKTAKKMHGRKLDTAIKNVFENRQTFKGVLADHLASKIVMEHENLSGITKMRRSIKKSVEFSEKLVEVLNENNVIQTKKLKEIKREQERTKEKKRNEDEFKYRVDLLKKNFSLPTDEQNTTSAADQESMKENLPCLKKDQEIQKQMIETKMMTKRILMTRRVDQILLTENKREKVKKVIEAQIARDDRIPLKHQYIAEYKLIEKPILDFVKWNPYENIINLSSSSGQLKKSISSYESFMLRRSSYYDDHL